jgi:MerR family transcriptional regulator/heat shock protein HspR
MEEAFNTNDEPKYVISVAAEMVGISCHTLRYYERMGILSPQRTPGRVRLYSDSEIALLKQVRRMMDDLGINLAGVEVALRMSKRISELEEENRALKEALANLNSEFKEKK